MAICPASHPHRLVLKEANCPYYCWGCNQIGFGWSYVCSKGCDFYLHKECGKPQTKIKHPFSKKCVLRFREGGPVMNHLCDACGKNIKGCHYKCKCTFQIRHLHPSCLADYEQIIDAANGLTLRLEKAATTKCLHCGTKDLCSTVRGWAYVSSCGSYCYHVSCGKEIINTNWKNAFFNVKLSDNIKKQFPEDMDKMHKLKVKQKGTSISIKKQAKALLSVIFDLLTGNPSGHFGTAQTYFFSSG